MCEFVRTASIKYRPGGLNKEIHMFMVWRVEVQAEGVDRAASF